MPSPKTSKTLLHLENLPKLIGERSMYINSNPVDYALIGKSTNGRRTYVSRLNQVARLFQFGSYAEMPWHLLRHQHVHYVVKTLRAKNSASATINATLSSLRAVSREAFNLGQLNGDDLTRILKVKCGKGSTLVTGRHITARDVASLVRVCLDDQGPSGIRDIAIIGLLYACGLRRVEIADLVVGNFKQSDSSVTCATGSMRERKCWLDPGTRDALLDWKAFRGGSGLSHESPLFTRIHKGGRITTRAITDQSVYNLINKRGQQAGLSPCTPTDFRRSFITNLLNNNVDLVVAQRQAGHSHAATTLRYDRRKPRETAPIVSALSLPYSSQFPAKNV